MSAVFTDDFNRANNTALGANWNEARNDSSINTNRMRLGVYTTLGASLVLTTTTAHAAIADCKVQVTQVSGSGDGGPVARVTNSGATPTYYACDVYTGACEIYRHDAAASGTLLRTTAVTQVANGVIALQVSGTGGTVTLKQFYQGTQRGADVSDTSANRITSATQTGIYNWATSAVNCDYDDFSVDDLSAGGSALTLSVSDSISFSDARTNADSMAKSDAITLGEALAKLSSKPISDAITTADAKALQAGKGLSESITLGDAKILTAAKVLADAIGVSDARALLAIKAFADSFTLADSASAFLVKVKAVADSISFSEARTMAALKAIADAITMADARALSVTKPLSDSFTAADARALKPGKTLAEAFGLSDAQSKSLGKAAVEVVGLADTERCLFGKAATETISISDSATVALNGEETEPQFPSWLIFPLKTSIKENSLKSAIGSNPLKSVITGNEFKTRA
jgi:hypothetical protein